MAIAQDEEVFYSKVASAKADALSCLESIEGMPQIEQSESFKYLIKLCQASDLENFPHPRDLWIASKYDCLAEWDAYSYLAPLHGKRVLQIGGTGFSAIQFMFAGAREAWLLAPVAEEAQVGSELARLCGVKLNCRVGVAEQIPFEDSFFDAIYSGACAHHFQTEIAFPEIARVLSAHGRFSAMDPWKAPLYSLGIKILGKREDVRCRPLTRERVAPLRCFSSHRVIQHGTFLRYTLLAMKKLGIDVPAERAWNLLRFDDWIADRLGARRWGSSVAILAEK